jgi:CHAT domain-containing protein
VEAAAIRGNWGADHQAPLLGDAAVPDQVLRLFEQTDVVHFAGHGAFDQEDPLRSHLSCAPDASGNLITLQMLLERVSTMRARVVFLSACETGRVVAEDPLNDQLGLPGGLLIAGAGAVLATFWRVNDLAACLVLSKTVELWRAGAVDLGRALADAQRWLRTEATAQIVREWIEARMNEHAGQGTDDSALASEQARLALYDDDELLFAGALHWAAFHVIGRDVRLR